MKNQKLEKLVSEEKKEQNAVQTGELDDEVLDGVAGGIAQIQFTGDTPDSIII